MQPIGFYVVCVHDEHDVSEPVTVYKYTPLGIIRIHLFPLSVPTHAGLYADSVVVGIIFMCAIVLLVFFVTAMVLFFYPYKHSCQKRMSAVLSKSEV